MQTELSNGNRPIINKASTVTPTAAEILAYPSVQGLTTEQIISRLQEAIDDAEKTYYSLALRRSNEAAFQAVKRRLTGLAEMRDVLIDSLGKPTPALTDTELASRIATHTHVVESGCDPAGDCVSHSVLRQAESDLSAYKAEQARRNAGREIESTRATTLDKRTQSKAEKRAYAAARERGLDINAPAAMRNSVNKFLADALPNFTPVSSRAELTESQWLMVANAIQGGTFTIGWKYVREHSEVAA